MRLVDYNWVVTVSGLPGVTSWDEFLVWVKSKNVNVHSYITFCGSVYPSTIMNFKQLKFQSVINVAGNTVVVDLITVGGEMLNDLNEPTIAFEIPMSMISGIGNGDYKLRNLSPIPIDIASAKTTLVCF